MPGAGVGVPVEPAATAPAAATKFAAVYPGVAGVNDTATLLSVRVESGARLIP